MNPLTFPIDAQTRAFEAAGETVRSASVAPERAAEMADVEVGQTPSEVVYRENKLRLLHYEPMVEETHDVPILIVYALINRPYILDLQPNRSVVRRLLEAGFDVYLIDWGEPSALDATLTLSDYVGRYLHNCVDEVLGRSGVDRLSLLGYCMGGTMSAMYAALHPERVQNLALMATGLCFRDTGGVLEQWGDDEHFDPADLAAVYGTIPAGFFDYGFQLMDPVANTVTKYVNLGENLDDEAFVENFARMERWLDDGIDMAGETFAEYIEEIYQENSLYENEMTLDGEPIDLENLTMPILQIVGHYDHLVPPESSTPFNDVVPSQDVTTMEEMSGHIGLSVSTSAHEELWPAVADWFATRSTPQATGGIADPTEDVGSGDVEERTGGGSSRAGTTGDRSSGADTGTGNAAVEAELWDVEVVDGVGEHYGDLLRDAGVDDLADLAAADSADLASDLDVGEGRVANWVADARAILAENE